MYVQTVMKVGWCRQSYCSNKNGVIYIWPRCSSIAAWLFL